jgi:DNA modification methylase
MSDLARLIHASAHDLPLDPASVQMIATSPPYFGLRKYDGEQDVEWPAVEYAPMAGLPPLTVAGCDAECEHEWGEAIPAKKPGQVEQTKWKNATAAGAGQTATQGAYCQKCGGWRGPLGNEPTLEAYIGHLILCAREWRRVLRNDGVMFCNLGDSYANDGKWGGSSGGKHVKELHGNTGVGRAKLTTGLLPKNLMMVPARFALAMQADGWILRSEMVWAKPNPMPESVTDRPTKAHEMIYLFSKRERYFWDADAVREPLSEATLERDKYGRPRNQFQAFATGVYHSNEDMPSHFDTMKPNPNGRNLRSVLTIPTQPYSAAHFATWPPALVEPMIKAGSRPGDVVLDPFGGSQTTGKVAIKLGRKYIGIDIAKEYLIDLAPERLTVQMELVV